MTLSKELHLSGNQCLSLSSFPYTFLQIYVPLPVCFIFLHPCPLRGLEGRHIIQVVIIFFSYYFYGSILNDCVEHRNGILKSSLASLGKVKPASDLGVYTTFLAQFQLCFTVFIPQWRFREMAFQENYPS